MKCYKCGTVIKYSENYCIRCGEIFNKEYLSKEEELNNILVDYWLKNKNYNGFSILYLIFNFAYAFYKKKYIIGVSSFIAVILLIKIPENFINIILEQIGFNFLFYSFLIFFSLFLIISYFLNFNNIYVEQAYWQVCKIIEQNKNKSIDELKEICKKKRKNNIVLAVLSAVLFFLIIAFT